MATAEKDVSQLSFESALKRLEEIVRTLEKGEAPLDQSIELYQEGDRLKRHCEARLREAQMRIEQIALSSDGQPAGVKPFDAG
ncbi:MAG TPA: exodeoxyribonuclease VII small subunit [Sphingomicrobium sp.]|nr:exodeoxyribonuclease VII small subunit [Sphingomicrobium sp.]